MITTLTLTSDQIDTLDESLLLSLIGDLSERSHDTGCDASYCASFRDAAGATWNLPTYLLRVGTRAIMWTHCDGAGVADVSVVDTYDDQADMNDQVRQYSMELAAGLDESMT